MDIHIIAADQGHPEIHAWSLADYPIVGLTIYAQYANFGISLTRYQCAQLIAALQDADAELSAREVAAQTVVEGTPHYFYGGAVVSPAVVSA